MKPLIIKVLLALLLLLQCIGNSLIAQQGSSPQATLSLKEQSIVAIAAFMAKGDQASLKTELNSGLNAGLTINEAKELLVHLYTYTGFPRSLNALSTLESVLKERKANGQADIAGKAANKVTSRGSKFAAGKANQTKLTGSAATGAPQRFAPLIDTFLKEHLFADIFSRDVLNWKTREIATISALASLGGVEAQLRGHFGVGLHNGITETQLAVIVSILGSKIGRKESATAHDVLQSVLTKTAWSGNVYADTVFPKGTRITNNNFTGNVWLQMLVPNDTTFNTSVGNVTFEPGARSNWHYHPGGQILLVTSGTGHYGEKGKPVRVIRKGKVIKCEPNVVHWHGAAPNSEMSHVTIGTNPNRNAVVWLQPVSDEEYKAYH